MADLRGGDARRGLATTSDRLARIERDLASVRSTQRLLRRGAFGPGTIPTSALQQPAAPGLVSASQPGVGVTAAGGVLLTQQVTVPARMHACAVNVIARVYAMNSTAGAAALLVRAEIADVQGWAVPVAAIAGAGALNVAPAATLVEGLLPGDLVEVRVWAQTPTGDWAANAANLAELTGMLGWIA